MVLAPCQVEPGAMRAFVHIQGICPDPFAVMLAGGPRGEFVGVSVFAGAHALDLRDGPASKAARGCHRKGRGVCMPLR